MEFKNQRKTILLICLFTIPIFALKPPSAESSAEDFFKKSYNASLNPDLCYNSLAPFAGQVKQSSEKLALISTKFCLSKAEPLKSHIQDLYKRVTKPKLSQNLKECVEFFRSSIKSFKNIIEQFKDIRAPGAIWDVQMLINAALTDQDSCEDLMKDVPDGPEKKDMVNKTDGVKNITSVTLDMIALFIRS